MGSVLNAAIVPAVYDSSGLGIALLVGFIVCLFSLANAFGMTMLDRKAESKEEKEEAKNADPENGFKFSDIYNFSTSYWLLTGCCVINYITFFPYTMIVSDSL
jgi:hypothetical protein